MSRDNPLFSDVRVRRALLHAIDREAMVQNLFKGEKVVSHLPLSRVRKSYKKALAASTVYKYDPERAKKLLAEAGWKPGSDGVLANAKGERMEFEFRVTAERRDHEQAQAIIADYWKKIGVRTNIKNMPNRLLNSCGQPQPLARRIHRLAQRHRRRMARAVSQQKHSHGGEQVRARKRVGLERSEKGRDSGRVELDRDAGALGATADRDSARCSATALPHLPLNYSPEVLVVKKGLTGITPRQESGGQNSSSWNMHQWDKI